MSKHKNKDVLNIRIKIENKIIKVEASCGNMFRKAAIEIIKIK